MGVRGLRLLGFGLALPTVLLWVVVAYLLTIEVADFLDGSETEHSPLMVVAMITPFAVGLTVLVLVLLRRAARKAASYPPIRDC